MRVHIGTGLGTPAAYFEIIDLPPTDKNFHKVQPLPSGDFLLVNSRTSPGVANAHVYSPSGEWLRSLYVGDGVEDVQTTSDGHIWVSYFDEGVYGGTDLEQNGLVCFDVAGGPLFKFCEVVQGAPFLPCIDDCYALNVTSARDAWLYYYNSFPLVHLRDGVVAHSYLNFPIKGSIAFAIFKNIALFEGGYNEHKRLFLVTLPDLVVEEVVAVHAAGTRIEFQRCFGRGHHLYLSTESDLYRLSLAETLRIRTAF